MTRLTRSFLRCQLASVVVPCVVPAIPVVANQKLKNLVSDLYKGAKKPDPIGSGSTADAIRHEITTGLPTCGIFHSAKDAQYIKGLAKWLRRPNNAGASDSDKQVAAALKLDLENALAGK